MGQSINKVYNHCEGIDHAGGIDPVSAIAGGVGSLADMFNNLIGGKRKSADIKTQSQADIIQSLAAMKAAEASNKKDITPWIVGGSIVMLMVIVFIAIMMKRK